MFNITIALEVGLLMYTVVPVFVTLYLPLTAYVHDGNKLEQPLEIVTGLIFNVLLRNVIKCNSVLLNGSVHGPFPKYRIILLLICYLSMCPTIKLQRTYLIFNYSVIQ